MKSIRVYTIWILFIVLSVLFSVNPAFAEVPFRISVKFILDANGNLPANGNCNSIAEINNQITRGNVILSSMISELRPDLLHIVYASGIDQYFNVDIEKSIINLRNDAVNNPGLFGWRNDAINIYINGSAGGAATGVALYPPDNDIIMISQDCRDGTVIHEIGHNLNLPHTQDDDGCSDTITDNANWSRDDISLNNFGNVYTNLTSAQQEQVDMVWFNIMSYHPTRDRLSHCQMDRESRQGYSDRSWLYSRGVTYVSNRCDFPCLWRDGSFYLPFNDLQDALNTGGLTGRVVVLEEGNYTVMSDINDSFEIVTRLGSSTIAHSPDRALYTLPVDLHKSSKSPLVRAAIKATMDEDRATREVLMEGEKAAAKAATPNEKDVIHAATEEKRKFHFNNALNNLIEAERHATGDEEIAIQLELAQRYRDSGNFEEAIKYFEIVANATEQEYLKIDALQNADKCRDDLKKIKNKY